MDAVAAPVPGQERPSIQPFAEAAAPAVRPAVDRIGSLDFVSGWALFGILLMNITSFGLAYAYSTPINDGGQTGADLWSWIIIQVGFEGTQRGLFSLLFGASIILFTTKAEARAPAMAADLYMRRNLWLIAFGVFNVQVLLWGGDILFSYGATALVAFAFRKLAPRWLILIGVISLAFALQYNLNNANTVLEAHAAAESAERASADGATLTDEQTAAIETWEGKESSYRRSPEAIAERIEARRAGWASAREISEQSGLSNRIFFLLECFGDVFGPLLIGMALFKLGVLTLERPVWIYAAMVLGGYGIGLPVNIYEGRLIMDADFSLLAFSQAQITYDVGRIAMTIGHLGLLLLLYRSGLFVWLRRSVSAVGQMALTSYLTHSTVCAILFVGMGYYSVFARHELYYIVGAICLTQLIISPIWLKYYRFGPVEWLWRSLTYWQRQPMRRESAQPVGTPLPA